MEGLSEQKLSENGVIFNPTLKSIPPVAICHARQNADWHEPYTLPSLWTSSSRAASSRHLLVTTGLPP